MTRRFKSMAFSLTMKHVSQYERLDRDSQKSVGGGREPAADSPGDGDAPEDVEEDSGTRERQGCPRYRRFHLEIITGPDPYWDRSGG